MAIKDKNVNLEILKSSQDYIDGKKLDKNLGAENAGKVLGVGADGNIVSYKNIIPISEIANHLPDSEIVVNQKHQNQLSLTVSDSMPVGTIKTFYVDIPLISSFLYAKNKTTGEKVLKNICNGDTLNGSIINVIKNKEKLIYVIFYGTTTVYIFNFDANGDFLSRETTTTIKGLERLVLPSSYTPTEDGNISTKKYVDDSVLAKLDKNLGVENANKILEVGSDGNVIPTDKPQIPTALPNPQKLTFNGAVTAEYDGSGAVTVTIPSGEASGNAETERIEKLATDTTVELVENKLYIFPEMASLTYTLKAPIKVNIANEYHFIFQSGATATQVVHPVGVKIGNFKVEPNKVYEVSIMENLLTSQSWAVV